MDFEYEEDSQQRRPAAQEASLPFKEEEHDDASAEAAARSSSVRIGGIGVPNATIPQQTNMINVSSDLFYECAQCGEDNELKAKDAIRCRQCGYRILFKKRTNKVVQFEAR